MLVSLFISETEQWDNFFFRGYEHPWREREGGYKKQREVGGEKENWGKKVPGRENS